MKVMTHLSRSQSKRRSFKLAPPDVDEGNSRRLEKHSGSFQGLPKALRHHSDIRETLERFPLGLGASPSFRPTSMVC